MLTKKGLHSKEKIVETALTLIKEKGYQETTMQDICDASGVATGTFYHYFKSKQDVVTAYVTQENEAMLDYYHHLSETSFGQSILIMLAYKLNWYASKGPELVGSLYTTLMLSKVSFFNVSEYAFLQIVEECFRKGQQNGEFTTSVEPGFFSDMATSLFFFFTSLWCNSPAVYPLGLLEQKFKELLKLVKA